MEIVSLVNDSRIQRIFTHPNDDSNVWRTALKSATGL